MCDVHLVPELSEIRTAIGDELCGECEEHVSVGEQIRVIQGRLDDGSSSMWMYVAHEDCYQLSVLDPSEDGCFVYGGAARVVADI